MEDEGDIEDIELWLRHSGWFSHAYCSNRDDSFLWLSSKYEEIKLAKIGCGKCEVRLECLADAIFVRPAFVGVNGGLSEYDFLRLTWIEVEDENESNWQERRTPELLHRLFDETL